MKGKGLGEARKLFRARKFPDVIRLLEPEVFRYRESFDYFWLLGFSCLHTGDLGGAFSYISRAHQLQHDDISALLGIAAIHFRRAENESAIKRWLEVLELQPSNAVARRGLDLLRRGLPAGQAAGVHRFGQDADPLSPASPPDVRRHGPCHRSRGADRGGAGSAGVQGHPRRAGGKTGRGRHRDSRRPAAPRRSRGRPSRSCSAKRRCGRPSRRPARCCSDYRDNLATVEINRLLLSNATLADQGTGADAEGVCHPADVRHAAGRVSVCAGVGAARAV